MKPRVPSVSLRHKNLLMVKDVDMRTAERVVGIPGVRIEPLVDAMPFCNIELPRNVWGLSPVRAFLETNAQNAPMPGYFDMPTVPREWKLYPHQVDGVRHFFTYHQLLLGDVMGLGKTRTAAASMELMRRERSQPEKPILVVGPKFLRETWKRELAALLGEDFDADTDFCALEGRDYRAEKGYKKTAKWIFCHYEILHGWWSFLYTKRLFGVIVDEAHLCKGGEKTLRGKGLAMATSALDYKVLLSGTPILNRPGEFYNMLRMLQAPWSFGTPRDFRTRYAGAVSDGYGLIDTKPTNTDELRARLDTCYLRRTLDDAGVNLPPLTRSNLVVDLDELALAKYRKLLDGRDVTTIVDAFERGLGGKKSLEWLVKLRKITTKAKIPVVLGDLEAVTAQGEKAVVFVWQRETADEIAESLEKMGIRAVAIHGGYTQEDRDRAVDLFQTGADGPQVIVATYGALSVGVTLHRARTIYLVDIEWVPATMLQAEARVYRIGQSRGVQSKWVVAENTLDSLIVEKVQAKAQWVSGLVGDEEPEGLATHLSETFVDRRLEDDIANYLSAWSRA